MNTQQLQLTAIFCFLLFITACKKDNIPPVKPSCKIDKEYLFAGNPKPIDSVTVFYEGNNISRHQSNRGIYFSFEYQDNKMIKRSLYTTGPTLFSYDTIFYNADGNVSKIARYQRSGNDFKEVNLFEFEYTNNKITKASAYVVENGVTNPNAQVSDYTYTGNNITKVVFTDNFFGQPTITYNFSYDNKENYHLKQSAQSWLNDLLMTSFFGDDLPSYISDNNVTKITFNANIITVTYIVDDKGNLLEVRRNGQPEVRYSYHCS